VINVIVLLNLLIAMMSNSYAMIDVSTDAMWSPHNKINLQKVPSTCPEFKILSINTIMATWKIQVWSD
jgi:hypothetical protein